ncbi:MAG: hypothetical protein MJ133_10360 [Lachnospiraceae bacterium]|nr:hypothetical protein [Lachnospiraceae bacterium]
MIRLTPCFSCKHFNDKEYNCPAYPEGVPYAPSPEKTVQMTKDCGNGIHYVGYLNKYYSNTKE